MSAHIKVQAEITHLAEYVTKLKRMHFDTTHEDARATANGFSPDAYKLTKLAERLAELGAKDQLRQVWRDRITQANERERLDPALSRAHEFVAKVLEINARGDQESHGGSGRGFMFAVESEQFYESERAHVRAKLEQTISRILQADYESR